MPRTAREKSDQFTAVTVDDSVEKIIQLDTEGRQLRFDTDPDRFKKLATDEIKRLSQFGQFAYRLAVAEWEERKDELASKEADILKAIEVGTTMGSATQRLRIDGKQPGSVYRWVRPDELHDFVNPGKGWVVLKGGSERTLGNKTGSGPHVITTQGSEELIAIKRSVALDTAERRARKHKKMADRKAREKGDRAQVEAHGVRSLGDDDRAEWHDMTEAEE